MLIVYDPESKQYLSKLPTEVNYAIWTPHAALALDVGSWQEFETLRAGWPFLNSCKTYLAYAPGECMK